MTVQDLYKVLDDDSYIVLYDINYSSALEVYQGDADFIPAKYMGFVVQRVDAQIIEGESIAYVVEMC